MKKALVAFAVISITFAACNGDKKTEEVKTGSDTMTVVKKDTMTVVKDTTVKTTVIGADSANKK